MDEIQNGEPFGSNEVEPWKRHAWIISSTAPAWFLMGIFFVLRWVLIGGERSDDFLTTAVLFTMVGVVLAFGHAAMRRHLATSESGDSTSARR